MTNTKFKTLTDGNFGRLRIIHVFVQTTTADIHQRTLTPPEAI